MQHGSQQLRAWQQRKGLDQRHAARELGVHFTTYNQFLSRRRVPGRALAVTIQEKTGIPVGAWTPLAVGKTKKRRSPLVKSKANLQGANA